MPSISKKYSRKRNSRKRNSRKRNNRKRGHSRRHASYNRRRNMFGGNGGTYEVEPFNAGNDSDIGNLEALNTLKRLGYVSDLTSSKLTRYMLEALSTGSNLIELDDAGISLQRNQAFWGGMVVQVNNIKDGTLIGQVTFKRLHGK